MGPTNKYKPYFPIELKYNTKSLKNLFKDAEAGEWKKVLNEISLDPNLVNATVNDEDAGKTILRIATLQFIENYGSEKGDQAYFFIEKLIDNKITLNIDAALLEGPLRGASVMWLLAHFIALKFDESQHSSNQFILLNKFMNAYCFNINAAPKEGVFKDVTVLCLLLATQARINFHRDLTICDSAPPPFQRIELLDKCNVIYALCQQMKENSEQIINDEIIEELNYIRELVDSNLEAAIKYKKLDQSNCYLQMMNIIEKNPYCTINFLPSQMFEVGNEGKPKSIVEIILSLPSSKDRSKLLLFLIFAGAKLTNTALHDWKIEYGEIQQKLNTIFNKAFEEYHYKLSSMNLPSELIQKIALNIVLCQFPDLQNFPPHFILEKIVKGFKF